MGHPAKPPVRNQYQDFLKNMFTTHSYRWTPIGDMDHLRNAEVAELQEFFNTYYVPNNAILLITGDIEIAKTKELVRKYFGWIPSGPDPKRIAPAEPEQKEARNASVDYRVPLPAVIMGWQLPKYDSDDHYTLGLLSTILSGERSGRLDRLLVYGDNPQAVGVGVMHLQLEDAGIFAAMATVMQGKDVNAVKKILADSVQEVIDKGVTKEELDKARTQTRVGVINGRQTADSIAGQLADEALFAKDPNRLNTLLAKLDAITPEQVQAVAKKYLTPEKSTTMLIKPDPLGKAAAAAKAAEQTANAPVKATEPVKPREGEIPQRLA